MDNTISLKEYYPRTYNYQPYRNEDLNVEESAPEYVQRMKNGKLANWPKELLREWLHRHAGGIEKYAFLNFEQLKFEKEVWPLQKIPGKEAFDDPSFCENFKDVKERAEFNKHDWLAHYMLEHGTWNTPIILLNNINGNLCFPSGKSLKSPFHLLEGHRRLSFLNGLKKLNKAKNKHEIWIAHTDKS